MGWQEAVSVSVCHGIDIPPIESKEIVIIMFFFEDGFTGIAAIKDMVILTMDQA
jgi:hypothetical protein